MTCDTAHAHVLQHVRASTPTPMQFWTSDVGQSRLTSSVPYIAPPACCTHNHTAARSLLLRLHPPPPHPPSRLAPARLAACHPRCRFHRLTPLPPPQPSQNHPSQTAAPSCWLASVRGFHPPRRLPPQAQPNLSHHRTLQLRPLNLILASLWQDMYMFTYICYVRQMGCYRTYGVHHVRGQQGKWHEPARLDIFPIDIPTSRHPEMGWE